MVFQYYAMAKHLIDLTLGIIQMEDYIPNEFVAQGKGYKEKVYSMFD